MTTKQKYGLGIAVIVVAAIVIFRKQIAGLFRGITTRTMATGGVVGNFFGPMNPPPVGAHDPNAKMEMKQCWANDWYDSGKRHFHIEIWSKDCNGYRADYAKKIIQNAISKGIFNEPKILSIDLNKLVNGLLQELNDMFQGDPQFKMSGNGVWGISVVVPHKGPVMPNYKNKICKPQTLQTCPGEGDKIAFYDNNIPYHFVSKDGKVCCYEAGYKQSSENPVEFPVQCDPKRPGYDVNGNPRKECGWKYPKPPYPQLPHQNCTDIENELKYLRKELENLQQMWARQKCNTSSSRINCKETKVINGITYTIVNVGDNRDHGPVGERKSPYYAVYVAKGVSQAEYVSITKQEYDGYRANCFKLVPVQPIGMSCEEIQNSINNVQSKIESAKQKWNKECLTKNK